MDDIVLFSDFDSGNMAKYERVLKTLIPQQNVQTAPNNSSTQISSQTEAEQKPIQKFDIEFNVWTRHDCDGEPCGPNANRTWFYFGVRGGHGKFIKFNLMNLNRQGRLFEMGMLPVFRTVPGHEKWSRILLKPTWQNLENNFLMSFIHRLPDRRDSITYFAFCFPFSYEECQSMLEKYDKEFEYCKYLNTDNCDPDTIYYHRELLCYSLDKRRIDLITISACNELTFEREPRFDPDHLFPKKDLSSSTLVLNHKNKRCFKFDHKRVYILTSRVHPGETPASFVFNGFLEFILRRDDPRARLLRKHFVFKLIPLLNPDGVSRGYYRTDQLGVNLNRVYLDPDFSRHPSIYAVKSLIVFHHVNNRVNKEFDGLQINVFKLEHEDNKKQQNLEHLCSMSSTSFSSLYKETKTFQRSKSFALPSTNQTRTKLTKSLDLECFKFDLKIGNENSDESETEFTNLQAEYSNRTSIYSPHLADSKLAQINPLLSGVAFYVDLHGHAAKRGCFIYGNSIENEQHQIENVLFAKLVSFNSQHFDFDGCNFSVKNMFMKDKREGLSKEGSGRVAMYKTLGLIHSYTLECCYASGRVMNTIPPALNPTRSISPPLHTDLPPKFMPEHYADVGKALAISALDILDLNPHTRVANSSFSSLDTIRNWIKFYIRSKTGGGLTNTQMTPAISKTKETSQKMKPIQPIKQINKPVNKLPVKSNRILSQRFSLGCNEDDLRPGHSKSLTPNFKSSNFNLIELDQQKSKTPMKKVLNPLPRTTVNLSKSVVLFSKINSSSNSTLGRDKQPNLMFSIGKKEDKKSAKKVKQSFSEPTFNIEDNKFEFDSDEINLIKEKNDFIEKLDKLQINTIHENEADLILLENNKNLSFLRKKTTTTTSTTNQPNVNTDKNKKLKN